MASTSSSSTPTTTAPPQTCTTADYTVTYPNDWHTAPTAYTCRLFSPAPIDIATEAEFRYEVELHILDRDFTDAINGFPGTATIVSDVGATVDGQVARTIEYTTNGDYPGPVHNRYAYLVDLGDRTLVAEASEYLDGSQATPDYTATKATVDQMMRDITLVLGTPSAKTTTCTADPNLAGVAIASDAGWDLDGDGANDLVELLDDPATTTGWLRATLTGGGVASGAISYLEDPSTAPAPLTLKLADLDAGNGAGLPEAVFVHSFGASSKNHGVMYLDGCQWKNPASDPTHGEPALATFAVATKSGAWGCEFGAHGEVEITASQREFGSDPNTPTAWRDDYWRFSNGAWQRVDGIDSTTSPGTSAPAVSAPCPFA